VRRRRCVSPSRCRHHACLTSAPAFVSACVCECLRARAQLRHGRRWLRKHGERLVSAPIASKRVDFFICAAVKVVMGCILMFCAAVKVVGNEGCIANVGGSAPHTVATACLTSPPLVFDVATTGV
jgi:hypothetical protein